jgi:hypothetical protein
MKKLDSGFYGRYEFIGERYEVVELKMISIPHLVGELGFI